MKTTTLMSKSQTLKVRRAVQAWSTSVGHSWGFFQKAVTSFEALATPFVGSNAAVQLVQAVLLSMRAKTFSSACLTTPA